MEDVYKHCNYISVIFGAAYSNLDNQQQLSSEQVQVDLQ